MLSESVQVCCVNPRCLFSVVTSTQVYKNLQTLSHCCEQMKLNVLFISIWSPQGKADLFVSVALSTVGLLAVEPLGGLHYIWLCKSGAVSVHYGPTLVKFFSKAVKLLFLNSFIIWECNKESLLFAVWCTHTFAHTQRPAFLLLSVTYYCPLVVLQSAAPFLSQQLSTLQFTWLPRAFVSLCLCGLFFLFPCLITLKHLKSWFV